MANPPQAPWVAARYGALRLPRNLHDLPDNHYLKIIPKFNGEGAVKAEDHVTAYVDFADNLDIDHEDVYTRIFVQSLEGNVRGEERSRSSIHG